MSNYSEWCEVCEAFAKKVGAQLLFVNGDNFGICYPDGTLAHIYADELAEILIEMRKER